jgi:Fe-S-cluster containining protein
MNNLLERYGCLLSEVDAWFQSCSSKYPDQIVCHNGCSSCCRGLFDITLLDAAYLKRGVDQLDESVRSKAVRAANQRLNSLSAQFPAFVEPWLLNTISEAEWDILMPEEDQTPCLLLSETGQCLVYEHRPMTCRLNGIPLIDVSGEELFDEWCTLNFVGKNPRRLRGLRFGFVELFAQELLLFHEFTRSLIGRQISEADLFIPAAIVLDFERILPVIRTFEGLQKDLL